MAKEKSERKKKLFYQQKNGYDLIDEKEIGLSEAYCRDYMSFLNSARTEREAVALGIELAEAKGFVPYKTGMTRRSISPAGANSSVFKSSSVFLL